MARLPLRLLVVATLCSCGQMAFEKVCHLNTAAKLFPCLKKVIEQGMFKVPSMLEPIKLPDLRGEDKFQYYVANIRIENAHEIDFHGGYKISGAKNYAEYKDFLARGKRATDLWLRFSWPRIALQMYVTGSRCKNGKCLSFSANPLVKFRTASAYLVTHWWAYYSQSAKPRIEPRKSVTKLNITLGHPNTTINLFKQDGKVISTEDGLDNRYTFARDALVTSASQTWTKYENQFTRKLAEKVEDAFNKRIVPALSKEVTGNLFVEKCAVHPIHILWRVC